MYEYFESLKSKPLKLEDMHQFYNPDVVMIMNGKAVAQGYNSFYQHFKMMLKKAKDFKFIFSKNGIIAESNKVAAQYNIIMKSGHTVTLHVIAIFTFHDGKISSWNEVVSSETPKSMHLNK